MVPFDTCCCFAIWRGSVLRWRPHQRGKAGSTIKRQHPQSSERSPHRRAGHARSTLGAYLATRNNAGSYQVHWLKRQSWAKNEERPLDNNGDRVSELGTVVFRKSKRRLETYLQSEASLRHISVKNKMESRPRLYVFPPSHYCERARWALDISGIEYDEHRWAVGVHVFLTCRIAPSTTLPILETAEEIIQGSGKILDWTQLSGGIPEVESRFESTIGVLVRRFIYSATLSTRGSGVRQALFSSVPAGQRIIGQLLWPITKQLIITRMQAKESFLVSLKDDISRELDWFEKQLSEDSSLSNGLKTRAVVTAASLLSPLARPDSCPLYQGIVLPQTIESALLDWQQRPAISWTNKIYSKFRR